jgi:GT2 family glycosyltransferase
VVDDGSADACADFLATGRGAAKLYRTANLGISAARNHGALHSTGDFLIFCDAHLDMDAGWWKPMVELLRNPRVGAVAPVVADMNEPDRKGYGLRLEGPDPSEEWFADPVSGARTIPLMSGCCIGMRRDTFEATGGFDAGMICWGSEDTELSLRFWLLGYEVWLAPGAEIRHLFREAHPYKVQWTWVIHNKLRLAHLHFGSDRLKRVTNALREYEVFNEALAMVKHSDAPRLRKEFASSRVRGDEWFFETFGPRW